MFDGRDQLEFSGEGAVARRGKRFWVIVICAVVALLAVLFFLFGRSPAPAPAANATGQTGAQLSPVTVVVPGNSNAETIITGTGTLSARREMPVGVVGEGGMVTRVLVEPGAWVNAGQVLATVDRSVQTQTAESLAAQVRVAEADARLAQQELERAERLVSNGFISKADIDRRTATRDQALARVRVAQAQLAETKARNNRLDIRAPAAGLVLTRDVEPGQIISAGSGVLFRMAQGGQMELRAQLSEVDMQKVRVGATAEVSPTGSTQTFAGSVWQVSPVVDPQNRQGIVRISLSYNAALRPGGFASARILAGERQAVMLPQSALQTDAQGNFVYIIDSKDEAARVAVTTGEVTETGVEITSGLKGDERVVATAGAFLTPGQKVKPVIDGK